MPSGREKFSTPQGMKDLEMKEGRKEYEEEKGESEEDKSVDEVPVREEKIDEEGNEELQRLLQKTEKYFNKERESRETPFNELLDRIEIQTAFRNGGHYRSFHGDLNEAKALVSDFHKRLKGEELNKITPEQLKEFSLLEVRDVLEKSREQKDIIRSLWYEAFREYLNRRSFLENRYVGPNEIAGGLLRNLDDFFDESSYAREQFLSEYPEISSIFDRFKIAQYPRTLEIEALAKTDLREKRSSSPDEVKDYILKLHSSNEALRREDDDFLDMLLGIETDEVEGKIDFQKLADEFPREEFWGSGFSWTPYELIRKFIKELDLGSEDTLFDLGSGYGRVPLYASLTTEAKCKGIEIVPERDEVAADAAKTLKLENVEFIPGNVLDQDYSDGTVFFLFNPFSVETLEKVNEKIKEIAKKKKIRLVSYGPSTSFFMDEDWIREIQPEDDRGDSWGLKIFESI